MFGLNFVLTSKRLLYVNMRVRQLTFELLINISLALRVMSVLFSMNMSVLFSIVRLSPKAMHGLTQKSISQTFESLFVQWHAPVQFIR